jgi:hypothetical protein
MVLKNEGAEAEHLTRYMYSHGLMSSMFGISDQRFMMYLTDLGDEKKAEQVIDNLIRAGAYSPTELGPTKIQRKSPRKYYTYDEIIMLLNDILEKNADPVEYTAALIQRK